jgi:hypothetical protein
MNNKKYKTLVIDPPWSEVSGGKIKRGAQKHYPVMKALGFTYKTNWVWVKDRFGLANITEANTNWFCLEPTGKGTM